MTASQSWSIDQLNTLRTMWADNATSYEIGLKVGKSRSAVSGKISRLKLTRNPVTKATKKVTLVPKNFWFTEKEGEFAKLWNDGVVIDVIAKYFGVSNRAVSSKRVRMGLLPRLDRGQKKAAVTVHKPYVAPKPKVIKPIMVPVPLLERTGCCFPVDRANGRHLFCNNIGELVRHSIYCDYHKQEMIRRQ
jgi:hypothetical protein